MKNSFELVIFLQKKDLLKDSPKLWWPNNGSVESLVSAILTQNTKWENVEKSLKNLHENNLLSLEKLANIQESELAIIIKPSGFHNQKSNRIKLLANNILDKFGSFESFQKDVTREWILSQKGVGEESADAIMCYTCYKDEMVVDKYTNKLLETHGYNFKTYGELKEWIETGINENLDKIRDFYGFKISLNEIYCRFHGKIVEYMKRANR